MSTTTIPAGDGALIRYQELQADMATLIVQLRDQAKQAFREMSEVLFQAHPNLQSFSWTQYTPYFNDGDECTFDANIEYPDVTIEGEEDTSYISVFSINKKQPEERTPREVVYLAVVEFLGLFDQNSYRQMFDDHVQVTVTRDGVEVESYDHD